MVNPLKSDLSFLGVPFERLDVGELHLVGLGRVGQAGFAEDDLLVDCAGYQLHGSG